MELCLSSAFYFYAYFNAFNIVGVSSFLYVLTPTFLVYAVSSAFRENIFLASSLFSLVAAGLVALIVSVLLFVGFFFFLAQARERRLIKGILSGLRDRKKA
jgi:hypothetical protein